MGGIWAYRSLLGGAVLTAMLLSACSTIPSFVLNGDNTLAAPAGPKVATLIGNMKCELW